MRETLFRGKATAETDNYQHKGLHGQWVKGSLVHQTEHYGDPIDRHHILYTGEFDSDYYDSVIVDPNTVGQYIGKVDKYGKKIFEGDIVKTKYGRLCVVTWFDSRMHAGWDLDVVNTRENVRNTSAPDAYDMWASENLEVVGNIHDNPEMLRD